LLIAIIENIMPHYTYDDSIKSEAMVQLQTYAWNKINNKNSLYMKEDFFIEVFREWGLKRHWWHGYYSESVPPL